MFERFTERARQVVILAQEEARMMDSPYIAPGHILLGVLREGEGVGALTLQKVGGFEIENVREAVAGDRDDGDAKAETAQIPFAPRAKMVLESALREALSLGHNYIGTEHILLALVRVADKDDVLKSLRAADGEIYDEVMRLLGGRLPKAAPVAPVAADSHVYDLTGGSTAWTGAGRLARAQRLMQVAHELLALAAEEMKEAGRDVADET